MQLPQHLLNMSLMVRLSVWLDKTISCLAFHQSICLSVHRSDILSVHRPSSFHWIMYVSVRSSGVTGVKGTDKLSKAEQIEIVAML